MREVRLDGKLSPNQKKSREYSLMECKRLIAMPDTISPIFKENIAINQRYSQANQETTQYSRHFKNNLSKQPYEKYFKVEDIDFTPLGLCRLIYNSIYARLNKVDTYVSINFIDEKSRDEKLTDIYKKLAKIQLREPIQQILGYDIMTDGEPENTDELEMYKEIGYKNTLELLIEKHIEIIDNQNHFKDDIQQVINHSLVLNGNGLCATHLYFDEYGAIIEEPIYIQDLNILGGTKRDYSDATGFIIQRKYNLDDFYEMVKDSIIRDCKYKGIEDEESCARICNEEYMQLKSGADSFNNITVKLCYWNTCDEYNSKIVFDENNSPFVRQHKGKADTTAKVDNWYMAYYVPTANNVYNYGAIPNAIRKKKYGKFKEAYCPVNVMRGIEKDLNYTTSVMSIVRKFEDMATVIWHKLQNEVARIKPTRVDIDIDSAERVLEKLKVVFPDIDITHLLQALNMGLGLGSSVDIDGDGVRNAQPFNTQPYPVATLGQFFDVVNLCMDLCFYFSGVPRIDAGVEQNPRISNLNTQLSLSGADNAILMLFQNKDQLIRLSAEKKMNMVIRLYQSMDKIPNPYASMFDDYEVKLLSDIDFLVSREYNIEIEKGYTEQQIQMINQDIVALNGRYNATNGAEGISVPEMLQIQLWLQKNPKLAVYNMEMLTAKKKREQAQRAEQLQKQNQESQMLSNQQAQQGQEQLMIIKKQIDDMKQQHEKELLAMKYELQADMDIKVKAFEAGLELYKEPIDISEQQEQMNGEEQYMQNPQMQQQQMMQQQPVQ